MKNSGNTGPAFLHSSCCWNQIAAARFRHVLFVSLRAPPLPNVFHHCMLPNCLLQAFEFETLAYALGTTCVHPGPGSLCLPVALAALSGMSMGPYP